MKKHSIHYFFNWGQN